MGEKNDIKNARQAKEATQKKNKEEENRESLYREAERTIHIIDILKRYSDENHRLKQSDIARLLVQDFEDTINMQTLAKNIDKVIKYTNKYDSIFKVLYDGYDDSGETTSTLELKELFLELQKLKKKDEGIESLEHYDELDEETIVKLQELKKAPSITGLYYKHPFSNEELNQLISSVRYNSRLSPEESNRLVNKIKATGSEFYNQSLLDDIQTVSNNDFDKTDLFENIDVIKQAISKNKKIKFHFYGYNKDKKLEPTYIENNKVRDYTISPYYIVAYNYCYYIIGSFNAGNNACFFRIDLMKDISALEDNRRNVKEIEGLDVSEKWNATKYMHEHLYMFYDEPIDIILNVNKDRYTAIYDRFGEDYKYIKEVDNKKDQIKVRCSPNAIVHFAMQYGAQVEVVTEEIREMIRDEMESLKNIYE